MDNVQKHNNYISLKFLYTWVTSTGWDCLALDGRVTEQWVAQDVEGSNHSLIWSIILKFGLGGGYWWKQLATSGTTAILQTEIDFGTYWTWSWSATNMTTMLQIFLQTMNSIVFLVKSQLRVLTCTARMWWSLLSVNNLYVQWSFTTHKCSWSQMGGDNGLRIGIQKVTI
jgi:hypothetical protein